MMSTEAHKALEPLLKILKEMDGYFVLRDSEGNSYILGRVEDILEEEDEEDGVQLSLPKPAHAPERKSFVVRTTADELLEKINREIAVFQLQNEEEDIDDLGIDEEPPKRVRFEPLRGDLAPELQE